jgi:hypothetical protein
VRIRLAAIQTTPAASIRVCAGQREDRNDAARDGHRSYQAHRLSTRPADEVGKYQHHCALDPSVFALMALGLGTYHGTARSFPDTISTSLSSVQSALLPRLVSKPCSGSPRHPTTRRVTTGYHPGATNPHTGRRADSPFGASPRRLQDQRRHAEQK